jgi:DNA helicase-2/ATP-dependent DNA helicase PcrA
VEILCSFFHGRGGAAPTKGDLAEAARFRAALVKWNDCVAKGKAVPANSVLQATFAVHQAVAAVKLTGDELTARPWERRYQYADDSFRLAEPDWGEL